MLTGHNGGPPLEDEAPDVLAWRSYTWRRAHKRAWKTPPPVSRCGGWRGRRSWG